MRLQVGMHVKIVGDEKRYLDDAGKTKQITKHLRDFEYGGKSYRAYELDNEKNAIWIEEDFEYCIEYPHLKID